MINASPQRRVHVFVVRFWHEPMGDSSTNWRGRVQDVKTGEVLYFRDVAVLLAFLSTALNILPGPDATQE